MLILYKRVVKPMIFGSVIFEKPHFSPETGECNIKNCDTGDVACDSYHQTQRDIDQLKYMGIKHYRK